MIYQCRLSNRNVEQLSKAGKTRSSSVNACSIRSTWGENWTTGWTPLTRHTRAAEEGPQGLARATWALLSSRCTLSASHPWSNSWPRGDEVRVRRACSRRESPPNV